MAMPQLPDPYDIARSRRYRRSWFTNLEWRRNDSAHGGNPKTKRIHLSCPSLLKNARTNLLFASSRLFLWPQGIPRFIQHGLQKRESFWVQCNHDNQRRLYCCPTKAAERMGTRARRLRTPETKRRGTPPPNFTLCHRIDVAIKPAH